jgi:1,4-alpha-glucan branching enzyme
MRGAMASGVPKSQTRTPKKVSFEFFAPQAERIELVGNFNGWDPEPLKKDRRGKWKITLNLLPGRYEYRFRVDGNWQNDQKTVECVPNPYGSWNCVLEVR